MPGRLVAPPVFDGGLSLTITRVDPSRPTSRPPGVIGLYGVRECSPRPRTQEPATARLANRGFLIAHRARHGPRGTGGRAALRVHLIIGLTVEPRLGARERDCQRRHDPRSLIGAGQRTQQLRSIGAPVRVAAGAQQPAVKSWSSSSCQPSRVSLASTSADCSGAAPRMNAAIASCRAASPRSCESRSSAGLALSLVSAVSGSSGRGGGTDRLPGRVRVAARARVWGWWRSTRPGRGCRCGRRRCRRSWPR